MIQKALPTSTRLLADPLIETVALGLLAFKIAGNKAGAVLGTALAIKMIAYVGVAPVVGGFANLLPRRAFLAAMDLVRATVALVLPFVDQVWQVYALIFVLQSASTAFTPTFQATIPDILPEEEDYTRALSLSRLAYDMESLVSPMLAAALVALISFNWLFAGTVIGFICLAALIASVSVPQPAPSPGKAGIYDNTTRGIRIYLSTPRLRGFLALNLSVAAAGAMVIIDSVFVVKGILGGSDRDLAIALACFGGSMTAALVLPSLLEQVVDRTVMLLAAAALGIVLIAFAGVVSIGPLWPGLLAAWALLGVAYSAVMTPSGGLLRRSAHPVDRPALFAAQFALSHACWLLTYPLAGWLGPALGLVSTVLVLAALTVAGAIVAARLWPAEDPEIVMHHLPELPAGHPRLREMQDVHAHAFVIDELHPKWP